MKTLSCCAEEAWQSVCSHVKHAVVFIDNACAECLHWQGGLPLLAKAGATHVKEFSPFEFGRKEDKKAVFIVSSLLFDETADVIRDILRASSFQYVIVLTSASPVLHWFAKTGALEGGHSENIFQQFEDQLLEWMGNMNYTAEVAHVPISQASPVPGLFVTPAFSTLFPLLESDLKRIELQYNARRPAKGERVSFTSLEDLDSNCLPKELKLQYKHLACCVNELLQGLGVREEVYSLGHTAQLLAVELENLPAARARRKSMQAAASVLFVDRTLDLASVTGHQGDVLLDRVINALPSLNYSNDILINMAAVSNAQSDDSTVVCNGCLAQDPNSPAHALLNMMAASKQKESLMDINRQLVEAATKEKLPLKLSGRPGRVTAEQIMSTVRLFRGNNAAIDNHCGLLQLATATAQALDHPGNGRHDNVIGAEKLVLQELSEEDSPSALSHITQLIQTEMEKPCGERKITLDDILILLVHFYSLAGDVYTASEEEENQAKVAFTNAILKEKEALPDLVQQIVGETVTRSVVMAMVDDLWNKLEAIGSARSHLKHFGSVVEAESAVAPPTYRSLLRQVTEFIFNPEKPDLVDIQYKSSGFKDLLKTGFGFFMNVRKPRPSDHPLLLIFVVGGVNFSEIKQIREVVSSLKANTEVIVGSTHLVTPGDVVQRALSQDNLLSHQH